MVRSQLKMANQSWNNDDLKKMIQTIGNGIAEGGLPEGDSFGPQAIHSVVQDPQFKSMLSSVSDSFGLDSNHADDISDMLNSPTFANDILEMTSSLNIDSIVETAGGMFGMDNGKLDGIKQSISTAKHGLADLYNTPSDISVTINITQANAYTGYRKKLTVKRLRYSSDNGGKWQQEKQKLVLNIPSGTRHGKMIQVDGEGDEYMNSANELRRCNLQISVNVENDPNFRLVGNDFYYTLDTDLSDFNVDKYYAIKFLDEEEITLFKPSSFPLKNRLVGVVDSLGMPPGDSIGDQASDAPIVEVTDPPPNDCCIGKLFVLFNLRVCHDGHKVLTLDNPPPHSPTNATAAPAECTTIITNAQDPRSTAAAAPESPGGGVYEIKEWSKHFVVLI